MTRSNLPHGAHRASFWSLADRAFVAHFALLDAGVSRDEANAVLASLPMEEAFAALFAGSDEACHAALTTLHLRVLDAEISALDKLAALVDAIEAERARRRTATAAAAATAPEDGGLR